MKVGWVCWQTKGGLTAAHYVAARGTAPLCGFRGAINSIPRGVNAADRLSAPADASRCKTCDRLTKAPA